MTQQTSVYEVTPAQAAALKRDLLERLPADRTEWRSVPHARFAVKSGGTVVTCYASGKLVVQGRDLSTFESRFLGSIRRAAERSAPTAELTLDRPTVASDETGKGDYFGPLVVAAVYATPADRERLTELRVADSKTIADDRARRIASALERALDHEIVVLEPEAYNERHAAIGNVNVILAELHATALAALLARHPDTSIAIVDRFAKEQLVDSALRARADEVPRLLQIPGAERSPAVAAASILARAAFLDGLARCSDACGTDLHKGAGAPVDVAARRVVEIGGRALLGRVAKLHFKNTSRVVRLS